MRRAAAAGLLALALWALVGDPSPEHGAAAWPSLAHPLGVDQQGRDVLALLAHGAAGFVPSGLAAVAALVLAFATVCWRSVGRPALAPPARGEGWFLLASPPRLLVVMLVMLVLPEPSPWAAAAVVTALYVPLALDEARERLAGLARDQQLAGLVAHGLSQQRIVGRHLLGGHLRELLLRHAGMLFVQVAFTQIALSYVFGGAAVRAGLGVSWGMELRRFASWLPSPIAALHVLLLVAACALLLGGLLPRRRRA